MMILGRSNLERSIRATLANGGEGGRIDDLTMAGVIGREG